MQVMEIQLELAVRDTQLLHELVAMWERATLHQSEILRVKIMDYKNSQLLCYKFQSCGV